jgi:hypothetical protein
MRILATGFLARQYSRVLGRSQDYTSTEDMFFRALDKLGHQVDYRLPDFSEQDLAEKYDIALMGLGSPQMRVTFGKRFKAVSVMAQLPCVFYMSDWQVSYVGVMLNSSNTNFFSTVLADHESYAVMNDEIMRVISSLRSRLTTCVVPVHSWGKPDDFRVNHCMHMRNMLGWDPTPLALELFKTEFDTPRPPMRERHRRWVLASLLPYGKHLKQMSNKWPIVGSWSRAHGYIPERTLLNEWMTSSCGTIAPSRWSNCKITGWWRLRTFLALAARCAIQADQREMFGLDTAAFPEVQQMERMTDSELEHLVDKQRTQILQHAPSMDECLGRLQYLLENAQVRV